MNNAKQKFQHIVVFIKDEAMLNEVRGILESNGEKVYKSMFMKTCDDFDFLCWCERDDDWSLAIKSDKDTEITLDEFKALFND